jgi:hypothetical protein
VSRLIHPLQLPKAGARVLSTALRLGSAGLEDMAHLVELVAGVGASTVRPTPPQSRPAAPAPRPVPRPPAARRPSFGASQTDTAQASSALAPKTETAPKAETAPTRPHASAVTPVHSVEAVESTAEESLASAPDPLDSPAHVDEELVLVAEFAEPGAENGAGAHVHVEEPWKGYAELTAPEVIDRLVTQSDSALALVVLYEQSHRGRRTVIAAARADLRRRATSGSAAVPAS